MADALLHCGPNIRMKPWESHRALNPKESDSVGRNQEKQHEKTTSRKSGRCLICISLEFSTILEHNPESCKFMIHFRGKQLWTGSHGLQTDTVTFAQSNTAHS